MSRQKQHCTGLCRMGVLLVILLSATAAVQAAEPPAPPGQYRQGRSLAAIGQVEFLRPTLIGDPGRIRHPMPDLLDAASGHGSELQPSRSKPRRVASIADHQTRAIVTVRFGMAAFNAAGPSSSPPVRQTRRRGRNRRPPSQSQYYPADKDAVDGVIARATNSLPARRGRRRHGKSNIFAIDKVEILELDGINSPTNGSTKCPRCGAAPAFRSSTSSALSSPYLRTFLCQSSVLYMLLALVLVLVLVLVLALVLVLVLVLARPRARPRTRPRPPPRPRPRARPRARAVLVLALVLVLVLVPYPSSYSSSYSYSSSSSYSCRFVLVLVLTVPSSSSSSSSKSRISAPFPLSICQFQS